MLLAIDIGSKFIHLVEGEYKNKQLQIKNTIQELTPKGCLEDGEIIDFTRLKMVIKEMLGKHEIKTRKVALTLNTTKVISREIVIPKVKPKEMYAVLEGELSRILTDEEEYTIEYKKIEDIDDKTVKVNLVALPKALVESYKKLIEELKLYPIGMDINQNAISKFVQMCKELENKNVVVADIGNAYMNAHLFNNQEKKFSTKTFINTEQCERTLLSVRRIEEENKGFFNIHISPQDLEEDIILETTMSPYLYNITQQITSIIQFQHTLATSQPIKEIYICGGMGQLKGFTEYLQDQLDLPVYTLDEAVGVIEGVQGPTLQYSNAIGALRLDINFFKRYKNVERQNKALEPKSIVRITTLGVLIIGIGVATLTINLMKMTAQMKIDEINSFIQSEQVQTQLAELEEKDKILQATLKYNKAVNSANIKIQTIPKITHELLDDIAKRMPQEVTVHTFNYNVGYISLNCSASSKEAINSFIHALRQSEYIHSLNYGGYAQGEAGYNFGVDIVLVPGGDK